MDDTTRPAGSKTATNASRPKTAFFPNRAFFLSRGFNLTLKIFIAVIAALLIFQLGIYVGFRKAGFSYGWGNNYQRNFGGPRGGFMGIFSGDDLMNGHGIAGTIAAIDGNDITIKGADNAEKLIIVSDRTSIIAGRSAINISDLRLNEMVTVIGRPGDDGTVQAEIIRAFDPGSVLPPLPLPGNMPPPKTNY